MASAFDYKTFMESQESALVDYMESINYTPGIGGIRVADIARMAAELESYDEYHLVYAILVAANEAPQCLLHRIPSLLRHESQAVRIAAVGFLERTPKALLNSVLLERIREGASDFPETQNLPDLFSE